MHNLILSTNSC